MNVNWQQRELNLKIVYYGAALSGKTTNLEQIHLRVNPKQRSDLVSLKTHEDRTLFFDFLQLELGKIGGLTPKIHLYTVPGQSYYQASRRIVLRGADGVVFVVDSSIARINDNMTAWRDMHDHLKSFDIDPAGFPLTVQFNKQDLPNAVQPRALHDFFNLNGQPTVNAVAVRGEGVLETLKLITRAVMARVQREMA